jgi:hypothetical protein
VNKIIIILFQRTYCTRRLSLSSIYKCTTPLNMLAYGILVDLIDECYWPAKNVTIEHMK